MSASQSCMPCDVLVINPEVQRTSLMPFLVKGWMCFPVFVWTCSRNCILITRQHLFVCLFCIIVYWKFPQVINDLLQESCFKALFFTSFHVEKLKLIYVNKTCTVCPDIINHKTWLVRKAVKCISAESWRWCVGKMLINSSCSLLGSREVKLPVWRGTEEVRTGLWYWQRQQRPPGLSWVNMSSLKERSWLLLYFLLCFILRLHLFFLVDPSQWCPGVLHRYNWWKRV